MQPNKRLQFDVNKLITSDFKITFTNPDLLNEFIVDFHGPPNTYYENGLWKVRVVIPQEYPMKSPSVVFTNKIFHPNIDWNSGSVCLDVINQTWSPMYGLENIFGVFLPQLLTYPNPADPMNPQASRVWQDSQLPGQHDLYKLTIERYKQMYAPLVPEKECDEVNDPSDSDMSSIDSD